MTRDEIRELLTEVAERLEDARTHSCAGVHCSTCYPAKNAEEIRIAIENLGELIAATGLG